MSVLAPSASNFQPWNGHLISQPSTVPPWPRWAPRCGQKASMHVGLAGLVAPEHQVGVEVVGGLGLADLERRATRPPRTSPTGMANG